MKRPSSKPSSRKKWKQQLPNYNQSGTLHQLNRSEQVILFRLRTEHNRLNAHMYNKFKVAESEMHLCNADIMTVEHLLHHCQIQDSLRSGMWPEPTLVSDKLYGNLKELRTAAFMRATGISVYHSMKKKKTACLAVWWQDCVRCKAFHLLQWFVIYQNKCLIFHHIWILF